MACLTLRWVDGAVGAFRAYRSDSKLGSDRALEVYAGSSHRQRPLSSCCNARTGDAILCDVPAAVCFKPQARNKAVKQAEFTVGQSFVYGVYITDNKSIL